MKNLIDEYRKSLKLFVTEEIFDIFIFRIIAFILIKAIYRLPITPNHLTLTSLIFGILCGYFIANENIGLAFMFLVVHNVLDCADGQLARIKKSGTLLGRFLDGFVDYIVFATIYIAILINTYSGIQTVAIAVISALSNILHSMIIDHMRYEFASYVQKGESFVYNELESIEQLYHKGKWSNKNLFKRFMLYMDLQYHKNQVSFKKLLASSFKNVDGNLYYKKNKKLMFLWMFIGPTTHIVAILFLLLIDEIKYYFWLNIIIFNIYMIVLLFFQRKNNRQFIKN